MKKHPLIPQSKAPLNELLQHLRPEQIEIVHMLVFENMMCTTFKEKKNAAIKLELSTIKIRSQGMHNLNRLPKLHNFILNIVVS